MLGVPFQKKTPFCNWIEKSLMNVSLTKKILDSFRNDRKNYRNDFEHCKYGRQRQRIKKIKGKDMSKKLEIKQDKL